MNIPIQSTGHGSLCYKEIVKAHNKVAFLLLMEQVCSKESYKVLLLQVEEKGLPKYIHAGVIEATIIHSAFKSKGITLIEVKGSPMLNGLSPILDWDEGPKL